MDANLYPQLAKMEEAQPTSQAIGEFLEWLGDNGMFIGKYVVYEGATRGTPRPIDETTEPLLARYFGIDLNAVERERRAILAAHAAGVQESGHGR